MNYLNINGYYSNILTERIHEYDEIMLFNPIKMKNIKKIKPKIIVGTVYPSVFFCNTIGKHFNIPVVNFMQGYEPCFENGKCYEWVELACKSSQNILAISNFLKNKCKENFSKDATVISNGINTDLLYNNNIKANNIKKITLIFRNNYAKGDFVLSEILKGLTLKDYKLEINIVYIGNMLFPINNNKNVKINIIKGPIPRLEISKILYNSDIYIDTSFMEGFGLTALEAMALGNVPIISQSFGIDEYAKDGENCYVVKEVNNANKYIEKVVHLLENEELMNKMKMNAQKTALEFDIDKKVDKYIEYFKNVKIQEEISLTDIEKQKIQRWIIEENKIFENGKHKTTIDENPQLSTKRKIYIKILSLFPKELKSKTKKILKKLINE